MNDVCFFIMFRSEEGERLARIVIECLRAFGGSLGDSPVWAFVLDPGRAASAFPGLNGIERFSLELPVGSPAYPFAEKVYTCARAEELVGAEVRSLVWLSLDCLIIQAPQLFDLGEQPGIPPAEAAFRPVHVCNIGSPVQEPLDAFWQGIYQVLGIDELAGTVESFVGRQRLRPYFNTHCFAFNPAAGLGRAWWEAFQTLADDQAFQAAACNDAEHQIFLHQAVLSALAVKRLGWEHIRLLPPEYNYPLHLLGEMPADRQARRLDSLVNAVYEEAFPWEAIEMAPQLRDWLRPRLAGGG